MLSLFDDLAVPSVGTTRSRINHMMIYAMLAAMPELDKSATQEEGMGQETTVPERKRFENRNVARFRTRVKHTMRISDVPTSFIASSGYSLWTHGMEGIGPGFVVVIEGEGRGHVECLLYMGESTRAFLAYFPQRWGLY